MIQPIFITVLLLILFAGCGRQKPQTTLTSTDSPHSYDSIRKELADEEFVRYMALQDSVDTNLKTIMQSIIDGDCEKLASVTKVPIYRPYPEKDIQDLHQLKESFHILFDDSIKSVLKNTAIGDWESMGWRGYSCVSGGSHRSSKNRACQ